MGQTGMDRIKKWIRDHKKQTIAIVAVLAVFFCVGLAAVERNKSRENPSDGNEDKTDLSAEDSDGVGGRQAEGTEDDAAGKTKETKGDAIEGQELQDSDHVVDHGANAAEKKSDEGSKEPVSNSRQSAQIPVSDDVMPQEISGNTDKKGEPHVHTWVFVSPENSYHTEYGAECRKHGYNGKEPMFFRSQNDLFLHQAADGCTSSWGSGFKGLAYKYCSGCGEEVITGHVHDFGTITKQVSFEKVVCECGMSFNAGKDYSALDSWKTHVEIYTSHGDPREQHDTYQVTQSSVTRYEATKTCTCGWRPVDNRPVY